MSKFKNVILLYNAKHIHCKFKDENVNMVLQQVQNSIRHHAASRVKPNLKLYASRCKSL